MRCFRFTDLVAREKQKNERRRAILRLSDLLNPVHFPSRRLLEAVLAALRGF
jgi:hypothetical protein